MTRQCFTMFHRRVDVDVDAGALVMKLLCFCLIAVISLLHSALVPLFLNIIFFFLAAVKRPIKLRLC